MKTNILIALLLSGMYFLQTTAVVAQDCFYKHLKGTIGKASVTMDLLGEGKQGIYEENVFILSETFSGSYTYDKYQEPISFQGNRTGNGMIIMNEYYGEGTTGTFEGHLDATGLFSGIWKNADESKMLPFSLREDYSDGGIAFDSYCRTDSVLLFEDWDLSPEGTTTLQFIWPAAGTPEPAAGFLRSAITTALIGDSSATIVTSPTAISDAVQTSFFNTYRYDMSEISRDDSMIIEYPYMYNYDQQTTVRVFWNQRRRISLGIDTYYYSGGAHGNYYTSFMTFDLDKRAILSLKDVFLPGFENTLDSLLESAVRQQYDLGETLPLTEILFEDTIHFNQNFYLTGKGIIFAYIPYEIAAYALGQIELYIPFSSLAAYLQPGIAE